MDMNKNDIIKYLAIAAGGYLIYWYITNHGPTGAVKDAAGNQVAPSYWDTWFGSAAASAPGQLPGPPAPGTPIHAPAPVVNPPLQPAPPPQAVSQQIRMGMVNAAGGDPSLILNADQWSYYYQQVTGTPISAGQFGYLFPNLPADRGAYTADQWLTVLQNSDPTHYASLSGLGMIVPATPQPSIPMMSFGGAWGGGFPAKKGWS